VSKKVKIFSLSPNKKRTFSSSSLYNSCLCFRTTSVWFPLQVLTLLKMDHLLFDDHLLQTLKTVSFALLKFTFCLFLIVVRVPFD
jgi:hypothetical protein